METPSNWLVKSGERILGPYTHGEVCEMLRSRDLVLHDEIAGPKRRWLHIRDTEAFMQIAEELRKTEFSGGDTTAMTTDPGTSTDTLTSSITAALDGYQDELTEEITFTDINKNREIVYDNLVETSTNRSTQGAGKYKSFGYKEDLNVRSEAQKTSKTMWLVTLFIITAAVGFVVFNQFVKKPNDLRSASVDYKRNGLESYKVGRYEAALSSLKNAHNLNPGDVDIYLPLGILLIQQDGQTLVGKRLLEKVSDPRDRHKALTGMGLAHLIDGDHSNAERFFKEALAGSPNYLPAIVNLGATRLDQGDYATAKKYLENAIRKGFRDGAAVLMLAETNIFRWQTQKNDSILKDTKVMLKKFLKLSDDYQQEALVVLSFIDTLKSDNSAAEKSISRLIDIDPIQTDLHRHDLFVFRKPVSWQALYTRCQQVYRQLRAGSSVKAFYALCALKAGKNDQAKSAIDGAVAQAPKNPVVQALYGYVMQELGFDEQSIVALGRSAELNRGKSFKLPIILQGRYCQEARDYDCAHQSWSELVRIESSSLHALTGMAVYNWTNKNPVEAKNYLNRGLKRSPNYIPLLDLSEVVLDQ